MIKTILTTAWIFTLFYSPSLSQRSADEDFMNTASQANMAEIAAGTVAKQKAGKANIRAFADSMVTDHTIAQQELVHIAATLGVQLKQTPDTEHEASVKQLQALSGKQFDSTYMNLQLMDHQVTVQLFQQESREGKDSVARNYAAKYLPKLQHHQMMAKELWIR